MKSDFFGKQIGFLWKATRNSKEANNAIFFGRVEDLKEFKTKHGHLEVPRKYNDIQGLGVFVNNTRTEYKKFIEGKQTSLTKERVNTLNEIGFLWRSVKGHLNLSEDELNLSEDDWWWQEFVDCMIDDEPNK